jgi:RimJ/RimL family protein N-acetyltransferase
MALIPSNDFTLKDGRPVTLRCAGVSDAAQLRATIAEYIAENEGMSYEPDEYKKTDAEILDWIRGMNENICELLLIAVVEGQIVGNIDFHVGVRKRFAHSGEFGMGILPEFRSLGLGNILLDSMVKWAESIPALEKINLRVVSTNQRAMGLYRKFGFREEGRRLREVKYADGSYADDVVMGKFLRE